MNEYVSVTDCKIGDVVWADGIKVQLETEKVFTSNNCGCPDGPHDVKRFTGPVLNWPEVSGIIGGLSRDRRWTVQGNHLAMVGREV